MWASLAPLDSAAIAPGVLSVEGNRKTIQHLEGGIVDNIEIKEGDLVEAGQVLVRLDQTQPARRSRAAEDPFPGRECIAGTFGRGA